MVFFPLGPAYGGIISGFPAAALVKYALPQIPPWRDAAPAVEQRDFVSISKHKWTQLAQRKKFSFMNWVLYNVIHLSWMDTN